MPQFITPIHIWYVIVLAKAVFYTFYGSENIQIWAQGVFRYYQRRINRDVYPNWIGRWNRTSSCQYDFRCWWGMCLWGILCDQIEGCNIGMPLITRHATWLEVFNRTYAFSYFSWEIPLLHPMHRFHFHFQKWEFPPWGSVFLNVLNTVGTVLSAWF